MSDDEYVKNIKVVVTITDADNDKVIETREMAVKDGEGYTTVELRARKMLMSMLAPEEGSFEGAAAKEAQKKTASKNVTNAQLKRRAEAHADVIQSMIRTLHSRGLMSEAMMKALTGKMEE